MGKAGVAAAMAIAATGCATLGQGRIVYLDIGGDNSCIVTIGARTFILPDDAAILDRRLREAARGGASALISPRPALARPGCWDDAVAAAQAAGFRRIGFFSEEPAPQRREG